MCLFLTIMVRGGGNLASVIPQKKRGGGWGRKGLVLCLAQELSPTNSTFKSRGPDPSNRKFRHHDCHVLKSHLHRNGLKEDLPGENKLKGPGPWRRPVWSWTSWFPEFKRKLFLSTPSRLFPTRPITQKQTKMISVALVMLHRNG